MPSYRITAVSPNTKDFTTKSGFNLRAYQIKLEGHDYPVSLNQKPETPAPQVGQELNGEVESGNFPDGALYYRFKKTSSFSGGKDYTEQLNRIESKLDQLLAGAQGSHTSVTAPNEAKPQPASLEVPFS